VQAYVYSTCAQTNEEYLKLPNAHYNAKYGDSLWRGMMQFKPQGWNDVSCRVVLNTPGRNNGLVSVSVNGTECHYERMTWRSTPEVVVSSVFFSTFYGGSKPDFACPADTCIRFKEFHVISQPSPVPTSGAAAAPAAAPAAAGAAAPAAVPASDDVSSNEKSSGFKAFLRKIGL
jgi:hypothetical protein